jgi:hypothetical protein
VLWCVRQDGILLGMTYERSHDVVAWFRHRIGGTAAAVESVAVIPGEDGEDRLWIVARRTVGGVERRTVELRELAFGAATDQEDAFFVDAGLSYDGRSWPATTLALSAATGEAVMATAGVAVFGPGDDGKLVSAGEGRARIVTVASPTVATVDVVRPFPAGGPFVAGAWSLDDPAITVAGLDHLEDETVALLADGAVVTPRRVEGGTVSLDAPATRVHAGLPYTATIRTLPVEAGADEGTAQGRRKRIHRLLVRLWRSLGLKAGSRPDRLDTVPFRSTGDVMDAPPPLHTGDMRLALPGGWTREGRVVLVHDLPLPFTVLSLAMQLSAHEP